jgi:hypothetical protein
MLFRQNKGEINVELHNLSIAYSMRTCFMPLNSAQTLLTKLTWINNLLEINIFVFYATV